MNLKSSGRASVAQLNLLNLPVCVLSKRLNSIYKANDANVGEGTADGLDGTADGLDGVDAAMD